MNTVFSIVIAGQTIKVSDISVEVDRCDSVEYISATFHLGDESAEYREQLFNGVIFTGIDATWHDGIGREIEQLLIKQNINMENSELQHSIAKALAPYCELESMDDDIDLPDSW